MSILRFAILIFLSIACLSANANSNPTLGYGEGLERLRYFYYYGIEKHLNAPLECREDIAFIQKKVKLYAHFYSGSKDSRLKKTYLEISQKLKGLEGKKSPCFRPVGEAYILHSASLLQNSDHSTVYALGVLLQWGKKIQLLTPSLRAEMGGAWADKNKKNKYKILGAYACSNSKIFIDPYLPPYDVGATFIHELSHLFLDKYVPSIPKDFSPSEWIAADEVIASMHSAFVQRKLGSDSYIVPRFAIPVMPYKAKTDLSFFNRHGDLSSLFKANQSHDYLRKRFMPYNTFLNYVINSGEAEKARFENIVDLISKYYFVDSSSLFESKEKLYDLNLDTLSPLGAVLEKYPQVYNLKTEHFNDLFYGFVNKLENESPACNNVQIEGGYLGAGLVAPHEESSKPSGEGTRTSGEGTRTSGEGTRTSGEGTRTSGEGTRTSGEGTRTNIYIKPCFNLYKEM